MSLAKVHTIKITEVWQKPRIRPWL